MVFTFNPSCFVWICLKGGGLQELEIFFFIDIQISGNSDLPVYMLTCFIRHFFLEFIGGQLSYHSHSANGNLT